MHLLTRSMRSSPRLRSSYMPAAKQQLIRLARRARSMPAQSAHLSSLINQLLSASGPSRCHDAIEELVQSLPPTPVTITSLARAAEMQRHSEDQALLNAKFMKREMTARRAHILHLLLSLPEELARQPKVSELAHVYWERLCKLLQEPKLMSRDEEHAFAERLQLNKCAQDGETRRTFAAALTSMQIDGSLALSHADEVHLEQHLDAIFSARVGLNFLVEHYLACKEPTEGFAGIIDLGCSWHLGTRVRVHAYAVHIQLGRCG
uniref:Protein-serine/threonine kinase n=1 Tax=Haptolina brevifila TaxID=156173 RepID=A0A7S2JJT2_9EUKA|mmetsp:Transcript_83085/g.165909  ORF Transcript_83085/g.165909 Transcript_83085/m.165909 type:complete len:263 (+) Transcript_83085:85-873(+)